MSVTDQDYNDRDAQVSRFRRLDVEGFTLGDDDDDATRHYKLDEDLLYLDHLGSGTRRGVVLVELGIDDHDCNLVRLDLSRTRYAEGARDVVRQTISTLEVILAQLEAMAPTPQVHKNEREAFQFGREAERAVGGLREVRS